MALQAGTIISLKGAKGDKGVDFIVGSGAPTGLAVEGAGYINGDTADLYRYTNGSWVLAKSLIGPMGLNGINGSFFTGTGAPTSSTYAGQGQAIYIQVTGEVWTYTDPAKGWVDSGENLTGQQGIQGVPGKDGLRGTQIIHGNGAFVAANYPNAMPGDMYVDDSGPAYTFLVSA